MNSTRTLARIAAIGCTVALGGHAMAGLVVYRYADHFEEDLIVNHNDILIAGFTPELTTASIDTQLFNSMRFAFEPSGGKVTALVSGNILPLYPSEPFQTLALCYDGGLDQLGTTIDAGREWAEPFFDLETGAVAPATLFQYDTSGLIDISSIPDSGYGYVGYATSDLNMFGYIQIQRLSLYEWRLIGYAYDTSGEGILVQNLVPTPGVVSVAGIVLIVGARRRR
ncbi:MAG: hypothetical protein KF902_13335 [Phycisphaeraceae bacterium]|nr:hypothetical protein [Phycisphaeraceae bacterium]